MTDDYDRERDAIECWRLARSEQRKALLRSGKHTIPPQNDEEECLVREGERARAADQGRDDRMV
jgi:hypothetical protein